jgi:methionyl-tRNA formyltransferase
MGRRMDAGAILGQVKIPVAPRDNHMTLHLKLAVAAAPLLLRVLDGLETGKIRPRNQDESRVVPAPKLSKRDGVIDWSRKADEIVCKVRAFTPWPGAFLFIKRKKAPVRLIITDSRVLDEPAPEPPLKPGTVVEAGDRLVVSCGEGLLEILRLKREGKKEMTAREFLRGMPLEKGMALSAELPEI